MKVEQPTLHFEEHLHVSLRLRDVALHLCSVGLPLGDVLLDRFDLGLDNRDLLTRLDATGQDDLHFFFLTRDYTQLILTY